MIFKQYEQVLNGSKTQTRRPVKDGEKAIARNSIFLPDNDWIPTVVMASGREKWNVYGQYAVQPGRGKKAVGRIRIKKIRRERLQEISEQDAKAEGVKVRSLYGLDYIPGHQSLGDDRYFDSTQRIGGLHGAFALLWDSIYKKPYRWYDNPEVWVLEFERVE